MASTLGTEGSIDEGDQRGANLDGDGKDGKDPTRNVKRPKISDLENIRPDDWPLLAWFLAIFVSCVAAVVGLMFPTWHVTYIALAFLALILVFGLFASLWLSARGQRIEERRAREHVAAEVSMPDPDPTRVYFSKLVTINVENLAAYYTLVKHQTNKSFIATLTVAFVGFILIGIGLGFGIYNVQTDRPNTTNLSAISAGAGVITEFIAAIFFHLYTQTVRQLKEYHDSLIAVQNVLLSFKIVGDMDKDSGRNEMIAKMLDYLIGQRVPRPVSETGKVTPLA